MEKIKMKRHESFYIREGWLVKGINAVDNSVDSVNTVFSTEKGPEILGIGTNMVKSLKYWMLATKLIIEDKRNIVLTDLAKTIIKYDRYLEDEFSLWILHLNLVSNFEDAEIFNTFFNNLYLKKFDKEKVIKEITKDLEANKKEFNDNLLWDEIAVIIKTYTIEENKTSPENNFICPFTELKLLKRISKDDFEKIKPNVKRLNYLVVYYSILLILNRENRKEISIDDLLKINNSPIKLLNLDKNMLYDYLDEMKKNELININKTAGLNMIYINNEKNLEEIFKVYFEER